MSELPPNTISSIDPLDRFVWGGADIGKVIDKSTSQTFYLLEKGLLDADKVGRQWRSTPRRLLAPGHADSLKGRSKTQPCEPPSPAEPSLRLQHASTTESAA